MLRINPNSPAHQKPPRLCLNCEHALVQIPKRTMNDKPIIQCALFYKLDLVTGEKYHDSAHEARQDEKKCGMDAKLYHGRTAGDRLF